MLPDLAKYNRLVNNSLLNKCKILPLECLQREEGMFFGSIINTWNHIMFGDLIILSRMRKAKIRSSRLKILNEFPAINSVTDIYFYDLEEFSAHRALLDDAIIAWVGALGDTSLNQIVEYTSTEGEYIEITGLRLAHHLFLHQIHHRGQITAALTANGVDYGSVDLPVLLS